MRQLPMSQRAVLASRGASRVPRPEREWTETPEELIMKPYDDTGDLIRAGYAVLSGKATEPRDWPSFRTYYAPNARLAPVNVNADGSPKLEVLSVDDYITSRTALLA